MNSFSETQEERLRDAETNVIVTPIFSGPVDDPSAHFAFSILNTNPDELYVYDSLEGSDLPDEVLQCVQKAIGSSTTTVERIGATEMQRDEWECGYLVFRRQFITLLVLLSVLDTSGLTNAFRVTDEWVRSVLRNFHDRVDLEFLSTESMAVAIKMFVNVTFVPVGTILHLILLYNVYRVHNTSINNYHMIILNEIHLYTYLTYSLCRAGPPDAVRPCASDQRRRR